MVMKLYYSGFGDYNEFVVADSEEQAILKVGIKINAPFLPIKVTEIDSVDDYEIHPVFPAHLTHRFLTNTETTEAEAKTVNTTFAEKTIEADKCEISHEEIEIKSEISLRHCKKCEFTCETQGQLLAHYREFHSKGD